MEWTQVSALLGFVSAGYAAALKLGWNAWQKERKDWGDERSRLQTERESLGKAKDDAVSAHLTDLRTFAQIAASGSSSD